MQNANFKLQIAKYQRIKKKITKIISSPLAGEDEGEGEINSIKWVCSSLNYLPYVVFGHL
jgi:hypothetical protein